jgi:hypothetical protein
MSTAANDTVRFFVGCGAGISTSVSIGCSFYRTRFQAMTFQLGASARRFLTGCVLQLGLIAVFAPDAGAEKLVDPNTVAPEYRDAAEKRRAEQMRLFQCSKKADEAKVLRRDRSAYVNECLDK